MSELLYSLVEFKDNSIEAVPSQWLNTERNMCFWPTGNRTGQLIRSRTQPDISWKSFACKELQSFCTLLQAREAAKFEESSDKLESVQFGNKTTEINKQMATDRHFSQPMNNLLQKTPASLESEQSKRSFESGYASEEIPFSGSIISDNKIPGLQVKNAKKQHVRNLGPAFDAVAKGLYGGYELEIQSSGIGKNCNKKNSAGKLLPTRRPVRSTTRGKAKSKGMGSVPAAKKSKMFNSLSDSEEALEGFPGLTTYDQAPSGIVSNLQISSELSQAAKGISAQCNGAQKSSLRPAKMAFRSAGHSRGLEDHGTTNQKNCSQQQLVSCGSGATELQLERLGLDYETSSSSESDEDGFLEVINTPQDVTASFIASNSQNNTAKVQVHDRLVELSSQAQLAQEDKFEINALKPQTDAAKSKDNLIGISSSDVNNSKRKNDSELYASELFTLNPVKQQPVLPGLRQDRTASVAYVSSAAYSLNTQSNVIQQSLPVAFDADQKMQEGRPGAAQMQAIPIPKSLAPNVANEFVSKQGIFHEDVAKQLAYIIAKIDSAEAQTSAKYNWNYENAIRAIDEFFLPFNTIVELTDFLEWVEEPGNSQHAICYFGSIGGDNLIGTVEGILGSLITKRMATSFCLSRNGSGNTQAVPTVLPKGLVNLVFRAAKLQNSTATCSPYEMEKAISNYIDSLTSVKP